MHSVGTTGVEQSMEQQANLENGAYVPVYVCACLSSSKCSLHISRTALGVDTVLTLDVCLYVCMLAL